MTAHPLPGGGRVASSPTTALRPVSDDEKMGPVMSRARVDVRPDLARLNGFLAELIERAGLGPRFRSADLTTESTTMGVIVGDGYELEILYMDQVPVWFSTWWHLDFPDPSAWSLRWAGLPIVGWRKPRSVAREASLVEGCEVLARLPAGIDELAAAAESAMVDEGTSFCEYGDAIVCVWVAVRCWGWTSDRRGSTRSSTGSSNATNSNATNGARWVPGGMTPR